MLIIGNWPQLKRNIILNMGIPTNRDKYFNSIMSKLKDSYTSGRKYNKILFTNYNGRLNDHNNLLFKNEVQLLLPGSNFNWQRTTYGTNFCIRSSNKYMFIFIYRPLCQCTHSKE